MESLVNCSGGYRISQTRSCQPIIWPNFSRKLHENKQVDPEGAPVPDVPLDLAIIVIVKVQQSSSILPLALSMTLCPSSISLRFAAARIFVLYGNFGRKK